MDRLQELCRSYLAQVKHIADKFGLGKWVQETIDSNMRGECEATESEVELLSRMIDDERIGRHEIPQLLGKSYRQCNDDGTFDNIKKLRHVGIYSKVSALLFKSKK